MIIHQSQRFFVCELFLTSSTKVTFGLIFTNNYFLLKITDLVKINSIDYDYFGRHLHITRMFMNWKNISAMLRKLFLIFNFLIHKPKESIDINVNLLLTHARLTKII